MVLRGRDGWKGVVHWLLVSEVPYMYDVELG